MKSLKRNEDLQKIFILVLVGLLFLALFFRPQIKNYRDNRLLLENKQKILQASHLQISEDEYLKKLSDFEVELDRCRQLIPEEEDQQDLYHGLKKVIEASQVVLMDLHFGPAFSLETDHVSQDQSGLYAIPIKTRIEGDTASIKRFFNALKEASPLMSIDNFTIEESGEKTYLDLEVWGYFF